MSVKRYNALIDHDETLHWDHASVVLASDYAALEAQLAEAREKLLELAGECAECGGSGKTTVRGMCGGIEMDCDDQPCTDCADIRIAAQGKE